MKLFSTVIERLRNWRACQAHVAAGGQALHVWCPVYDGPPAYPGAPACFRRSRVKHDGQHVWAHLFDDDTDRLQETARRLGVRVATVQRRGEPGRQHIDLCGVPLAHAIAECETQQETPA